MHFSLRIAARGNFAGVNNARSGAGVLGIKSRGLRWQQR